MTEEQRYLRAIPRWRAVFAALLAGVALLPSTGTARASALAAVPVAPGVAVATAAPVPGSPPAPTIDQMLSDVLAALATPALYVDSAAVSAEYTAASLDLLLLSPCTAAGHLRKAAVILQKDVSLAPTTFKPLVQELAYNTVRAERDIVAGAPQGCPRADVIAVDPGVRPSVASLTDDQTGEVMPIGALDDGSGTLMEFGSNTILLETNDAAKVTAFTARFGGRETGSITADPADAGVVATQHRITMDPARLLDTSQLPADLESLDPGWGGDVMLTSDAQTGRLLATAARAQLEGYEVELDLVGKDASIDSGSSSEIPATTGSVPGYNPNAFTWNYFRDGSVQDIEVTNAWQALSQAGKLTNKIHMAVLDSGFSKSNVADLPADLVAKDSGGVLTHAWDKGAGSDPWHGTIVADGMAGLVDNQQSAAGPAGPVVGRLDLLNHGARSIYGYTRSIRQLDRAGVKIVNISWGLEHKTRFAKLAQKRFDRVLRRANDDGMMIFAAAGNEKTDVDAEKCRKVLGCREKSLFMPCESARVICVGALADNSTAHAGFSNWGAKDVDIWAPGESVWVSPTPDCGACKAQTAGGTSLASPFAAGVAALIWAADPTRTPAQVWELMRTTAKPGTGGRARIYVYAGGAVRSALPANPLGRTTVTINAPSEGQAFTTATTSTVSLRASAQDLTPKPAAGCPAGTTTVGSECSKPSAGTLTWSVVDTFTNKVVATRTGWLATVTLPIADYRVVATVTRAGVPPAVASKSFGVFVILL